MMHTKYNEDFPISVTAIEINQPLGTFYAVSLHASDLLDICFSDRMQAISTPDGGYKLEGTQRQKRDNRLQQIAEYIAREDSAFPNSIILAANYTPEGHILLEDSNSPENQQRWKIIKEDNSFKLIIPSKKKLAAVIDGQHRLFAFANEKLQNNDRLDMQLLCSIYMDLPKAYQAQIFATINSTQKPVDKSLTFELYGYNISDEKPDRWTPDKLAVFLTRKLNTDSDSPMQGKVKIAPKMDDTLKELSDDADWQVSTAVIVSGVMSLISSNPTKDSNKMSLDINSNRKILSSNDSRKDSSLLRDVYINGNDLLLYKIVLNFLKACNKVFWQNTKEGSYITKTIGIQALFDILKKIIRKIYESREMDFREENFIEILNPAADIDFSKEEFKNASGAGRSAIRKAIEEKLDINPT